MEFIYGFEVAEAVHGGVTYHVSKPGTIMIIVLGTYGWEQLGNMKLYHDGTKFDDFDIDGTNPSWHKKVYTEHIETGEHTLTGTINNLRAGEVINGKDSENYITAVTTLSAVFIPD